jgi:hypothetical protein
MGNIFLCRACATEETLGDSASCEANCFTTIASSSAEEEAFGNFSNLNDC